MWQGVVVILSSYGRLICVTSGDLPAFSGGVVNSLWGNEIGGILTLNYPYFCLLIIIIIYNNIIYNNNIP